MTPALLEAATALAVIGARVLRARRSNDDEPHEHAEDNTYNLPAGQPIADELRAWLKRQREAVLAAIPDDRLPTSFPDLTADEWRDPMARAMTPLLASYWDESGKSVYSRLGLDPDEWRVVNPHLLEQIRNQSLAFCQSTNQSTNKRLGDALTMLRQELVKGMVEEGESVRELTKRVSYVFEGLSTSHARMIAATEASRAVHAAELTADIDSEVVAGLELLLSSDACPLCRKIATECKRVRLGEAFAVIGRNPDYRFVRHPPLHPSCQCTVIEVLKPEYGGPVAPVWGETLIDPQKGLTDGYKPPPGKVVPPPEPDRPKPRPTKPPPAAPKPPEPAPKPPPPEKAAIDQAVAYATSKHVAIEPKAGKLIESALGKRQAADCPALFSREHNRIFINDRCSYWQDPAGWMAANNKKVPPWFSTSDPDHIIVHEVGHAKHFAARPDQYRELKDRKFTAAEKALIGPHVSRYGATEPLEFVAEMYAGLAAGKTYDHKTSLLYLSMGGPIPDAKTDGSHLLPTPGPKAGLGQVEALAAEKQKFVGASVGKKEHVYSAKVEKEIAKGVGGKQLDDNEPLDVSVRKPGGGEHAIEVKSLLKGSKQSLSVHEDALLRKAEYQASGQDITFHTVAIDRRKVYDRGKYKENFSGHELYYRRGSGPYSLSTMHRVADVEELNRLIAMPDHELPEKARGSLPSGEALEKLRGQAERAHESRLRKDRDRKARIKAEKQAAEGEE